MIEEKEKNYPQNEAIFHLAKNRTVTRKKNCHESRSITLVSLEKNSWVNYSVR